MENNANEIIKSIHDDIDNIFEGWYQNFHHLIHFDDNYFEPELNKIEYLNLRFKTCMKMVENDEDLINFTSELFTCFILYLELICRYSDRVWINFLKLINTLEFVPGRISTFDVMMDALIDDYSEEIEDDNSLFYVCFQSYENMKKINYDFDRNKYESIFRKTFKIFSVENEIALCFDKEKFEIISDSLTTEIQKIKRGF